MIVKLMSSLLVLLLFVSSSTGFAGDRKKYEILPYDKPCMFFLDEETGEPTDVPANAPCDLHTTRVNPGDTVDPEMAKKYGKFFAPQEGKPKSKGTDVQRDSR